MNYLTNILGKIYPIILFLLTVFTISILIKTDNSFDQDLGRHLKLGEIILETHQVPTTNLFSYTYPDFPFINHHFLFEVFIYLGNQLLGIQILLILKILIFILIVLLTISINGSKYLPLLLPLAYLFIHPLRERTDLRPEILSLLFTSITYYILNKYNQEKSRLIYLLPIISLLWVNSHIYFVVGLTIQFLFLVNSYLLKNTKIIKTQIYILLASVALSLINPNFINGLLYPLTIFSNYGYSVAENQNILTLENLNFIDHNFLFVKICLFICLIAIIYQFLKKQVSFINISLIILGSSLALFNIRSFPYLFLICFPAVLASFRLQKFNLTLLILTAILSITLILEATFYLNNIYHSKSVTTYRANLLAEEHGRKALDFVLENNLENPIYNNFDIGSYIIYRTYPKMKVFVDGRPEAYPKEFFQNVYIPSQSSIKGFDILDQQYNFRTIIFSHTDQTPWGINFLKGITTHPDWKIVYLDNFIVVLVKNSENQFKSLSKISLENLSPSQFDYSDDESYLRIAVFLINAGYYQPAKDFIIKSLQINPDSLVGQLLLMNYSQNTFNQPVQNNIWW